MSSGKPRSHRGVGDQKPGSAGRQDTNSRHRFLRRGLVALLIALSLPVAAQFFYLVPDSAGHVAWVRSLIWDRDVDFTNEFARFGMIDREGTIAFGAPTAAGRPGNPFGLGSAIAWAPSVIVATIVARIAAAAGAPVATDGYGTATLFAVHVGTWTVALVTLWLVAAAIRTALPAIDRRARRVGWVAAVVGTPFLAYVLQLPSYSHVTSAGAVAAVLWLGLRWRERWTPRRALALGGLVGFAALVRAQDAAFVILPLGLAVWGGALGRARGGASVALYLTAALVVFLPQLLAWKAIYGSAWGLPQGGGFLRLSAKGLFAVLFHSRHGLFAWSPVAAAAIWGLVLLARDPQSRGLGAVLLAAFALQWVVDALPSDWWAGWAFGARRFVDCTPLFAVGLAALAARGRAARIAIVILAAGFVVTWIRVATRSLSGEADPGWGELWGGGFWGFLPHLPAALGQWLATSWTDLQVIRRPQSTPPDLATDPAWLLGLIYGVWVLVVGAGGWVWSRGASRRES